MPVRLRRAVLVLAVIGAFLLAADVVTSSPRLCASCHEVTGLSEAWQTSAHSEVACVECHTPPRAWYALPVKLADRASLLARDTVSHFRDTERPLLTIDMENSEMSTEICLECHSADREATSGFRILIDHPEHAARNGSCLSCHVRTAHPLPERGRAISLMAQCYTCHGKPQNPTAGTACSLCHPKGFELLPASHKADVWGGRHGKTALADRTQCALCHDKQWCTKCHGVEMPHPATWSGKPASDHTTYGPDDRAVCAKCHTQKPDLCSRCHHPGWKPALGTWQQRHKFAVREGGVTACMRCHGAVYCTRCHVKFATGE